MKKIQKGLSVKAGFTMIELIIVIAIVGILAVIVIVSVSNARNTAKDSNVKTKLYSMKPQSEHWYSTTGDRTYTGLCAGSQVTNGFGGVSGPGLLKEISDGTSIPSTIGITFETEGAYNVVTCHNTATAWAVEAPLKDSSNGAPVMWCIDSSGISQQSNTNLGASDVTC